MWASGTIVQLWLSASQVEHLRGLFGNFLAVVRLLGVLQAALVGFCMFMCASGPMPVHVPGTVARRAALIFVDAAGKGNSYRLGGVAWGAGWF